MIRSRRLLNFASRIAFLLTMLLLAIWIWSEIADDFVQVDRYWQFPGIDRIRYVTWQVQSVKGSILVEWKTDELNYFGVPLQNSRVVWMQRWNPLDIVMIDGLGSWPARMGFCLLDLRQQTPGVSSELLIGIPYWVMVLPMLPLNWRLIR